MRTESIKIQKYKTVNIKTDLHLKYKVLAAKCGVDLGQCIDIALNFALQNKSQIVEFRGK